MTNDQNDKITLVALLGGMWPQNLFMTDFPRKTPMTLQEFHDKVDRFINGEDTLWALITPKKIELE